MDDNIVNFKTGNYGTEFHGPFIREWKITCHGHRVPYIQALVDEETNMVSLCLDERFGIDVPKNEAEKWLPFIANCMAVAAGYSCHGENCNPINPFKVKLSGIPLEDTPHD